MSKSLAGLVDHAILNALSSSNTKQNLISFGTQLQPDMSKEEYMEFVKRNLKVFAKDIVTTLEDSL